MTADAVGGVWSYALGLARALAPHGVHTTLAVLGPAPSPAQRTAAARVAGLVLHHRPYRLEWMDDPWDDVDASAAWLRELEGAARPDVVHLNGYALGAAGFAAPVLVVAHSCVLSWWEAVRGEDAPAAYRRYRDAIARGLRGADAVVAPTRAMLDAVGRHYGPPAAPLVIPNAAAPAEHARAAKEPLVLSAGRLWDEAKNVAALDRAAAALAWPVYVAGDVRHPAGGEVALAHARALGPLDAPTLAAWMARAAVYALPARYEPFGLSALEAGLAGCALVLGDIPTLREVWDDAALYVPPGDADALAATLAALTEDAGRRRALGARARRRAARYTPARMAEGYLAAYARLGAHVTAAEPAAAVG